MISRLFCLLILVTVVTSCKFRDKNPELVDPIYLDIVKELRENIQKQGDFEKKVEKAKKEFDLSEPRSLERKNSANDLTKARYEQKILLEKIEYLTIREKERKFHSYKAYNSAFDKGESWPPKGEYDAYLQNKKLNAASRNWSDRVPRPARQIDPNAMAGPNKDKEAK